MSVVSNEVIIRSAAAAHAKFVTVITEAYHRSWEAIRDTAIAFGGDEKEYALGDGDWLFPLSRVNLDLIVAGAIHSSWKKFFSMSGVMKMMTASRQKKLYKAFNEKLSPTTHILLNFPPIDPVTVISFLESQVMGQKEFITEAIREEIVFSQKHFENDRISLLPSKVVVNNLIIDVMGERIIGASASSRLSALDSVFHILDGRGYPEGKSGQLIGGAIELGCPGTIETDYFTCVIKPNGTAIVSFKRNDLVKKFNDIINGSGVVLEKKTLKK